MIYVSKYIYEKAGPADKKKKKIKKIIAPDKRGIEVLR